MKFGIILLIFCYFVSVSCGNTGAGNIKNDISEKAEYLDLSKSMAINYLKKIDLKDHMEFVNSSNPMTNELANINLKTFMGETSMYSIIEEMILRSNETSPLIPYLSPGCMGALMELVAPIMKLKHKTMSNVMRILPFIPLGKILDSWGKIPDRILIGNFFWIGAYDECSRLNNTKYCLSSMLLFKSVGGGYGSCFPKQCNNSDVAFFFSQIQNHTKGMISFTDANPSFSICEEPVKYEKGQIITLTIFAMILALCLVGTVTEMILDCLNTEKTIEVTMSETVQEEEGKIDGLCESSDVSDDTRDKTTLILPPTNVKGNAVTNIITCFSLIRNIKAILSTKVQNGTIRSINGVRVISMLWIILGHYYVFLMLSKTDNILNVVTLIYRFSFLVVTNASVAVDSFFVLSGLLVAYITLRRIDRKNGMRWKDFLIYYIHRFIRLTPTLALVILFYTNILPIIISGPIGMMFHQSSYLQKPCYDYWWSTLFYFNNFHPDYDKQCVAWSWYLANDMQFYIIAPFILLLMVYIEKRFVRGKVFNFLIILTFCTISLIITAVLIGIWNLPAIWTAGALRGNPRGNDTMKFLNRVYAKPYVRIPPYLVGIFLGYLISRSVTFTHDSVKKTAIIVGGWVCAIVTALSIVYGTWHIFREKNQRFFNDVENVFYGTFQRFGWGCAVAWLIYACQNKAGGLINKFLSWKVWIPLGRLTYGAYLIHVLVYLFYFFSQENFYHYQDNNMVFHVISVAFVSYACAFILAICVEYPLANLEQKMYKR